jgi:hypothetical protein
MSKENVNTDIFYEALIFILAFTRELVSVNVIYHLKVT